MVKWKRLKSCTMSCLMWCVCSFLLRTTLQQTSRRSSVCGRAESPSTRWFLRDALGFRVNSDEYMRVLLFSPQLRQVLFEIFMKNYRVRRNLIQTRLTQELGDAVTKTDVDRLLKVRMQDFILESACYKLYLLYIFEFLLYFLIIVNTMVHNLLVFLNQVNMVLPKKCPSVRQTNKKLENK